MRFPSIIEFIQHRLDFRNWTEHPQFAHENGLGRTALIAYVLGSILTTHFIILIFLCMELSGFAVTTFLGAVSAARVSLLLQWVLFIIALCVFHLAEFFVTALFNPSVVNASSFVVNHSKAYTTAMLMAFAEFWIKFILFPSVNNHGVFIVGVVFVSLGQVTRSLAMITCGENFNHMIQHSKKESHVLVTHGIYSILRHPSYTGFYYWSVGTQLMLGNILNSLLFAVASWYFFHRRIPYEEQLLLKLFPTEYPSYISETIIGIPFIKSLMVKSS